MLILYNQIYNPDLQPKFEPRMHIVVVQSDWYTLNPYSENWLLSWIPSASSVPEIPIKTKLRFWMTT